MHRLNQKYEASNSISPLKWMACDCELSSASLEIWNAGGITLYHFTFSCLK
jgi:hypothetical protein